MPWRDLVFPTEGITQASEHQHCLSVLQASEQRLKLLRQASEHQQCMSLLDVSFSSLARPSNVAVESIAVLAEEVDKFQRRAGPVATSPVNTSPCESPSEWFDALNNESGVDAGGLDTRISSAAASREEEATFLTSVRENLATPGADA
ncbi:hypothetical protein T484DRAFT_2020023 [Baffinella frigidus]|jgi:hypothetical protein|nr:hypothetical protein T484DRAFT_2020023 [Cryptophyta sp. CCMP2293]